MKLLHEYITHKQQLQAKHKTQQTVKKMKTQKYQKTNNQEALILKLANNRIVLPTAAEVTDMDTQDSLGPWHGPWRNHEKIALHWLTAARKHHIRNLFSATGSNLAL